MKKTFVIVLLLTFFSQFAKAQNPINWTKEQLMEPADLAQAITTNKDVPLIYSVGPGASIPQSVVIGPVHENANLETFTKGLASLSKDANIVVYCGCCPFEHCPNIRPAIAALKGLHFTNYKLLNLSHNLKADWIDKGYPVVK